MLQFSGSCWLPPAHKSVVVRKTPFCASPAGSEELPRRAKLNPPIKIPFLWAQINYPGLELLGPNCVQEKSWPRELRHSLQVSVIVVKLCAQLTIKWKLLIFFLLKLNKYRVVSLTRKLRSPKYFWRFFLNFIVHICINYFKLFIIP